MTILEDIRVGDIVLCPYGEKKVEQCAGGLVHTGDDLWWKPSDLRNPEFRVGDTTRWRWQSIERTVHKIGDGSVVFESPGLSYSIPFHAVALVSRAAEKKPAPVIVSCQNDEDMP